MSFEEVVKNQEARGSVVGKLLPARWINLGEGEYTSEELRIIANEIDKHYAKIEG